MDRKATKNMRMVLKKILPKKDAGLLKKIINWGLVIGISLFMVGSIALAGVITIMSIGLPDVTDLENLTAAQSTEIFDREGELLYTIHGEENREYVEIASISQDLVNATIAIEDDEFYEHDGFDIWGIGKAVLFEIFGIGSQRGGSTITQQYVKNTFLSPERSYTRKIKELILSVRLEKHYEKPEILELYLNRIPYGNNAYGVEKAAEVYFGKTAKDLSLGESAILASLPQAPSRHNPFGDNRYSHLLKEFTEDELLYRNIESEVDLEIEEYIRGLIGQHIDLGNGKKIYIPGRSDLVLKRMESVGYITEAERKDALNEIQAIEFNEYRESIKHPHFVLYIKEQLEEKYGKDVVEQGGLKVFTTIDSELQTYAEEIAFDYGTSNESRYNTDNVAVFSINPQTGEILTMVGSRDYWNEEIDGNVNVVMRPRQPGSSFKPIVYAKAFYNGYAPGNIVHDVPTRMSGDRPQNYDGSWQGPITIRRALGQSRNIPAIKAYFLAGEQDEIIELAEKMGISTLKREKDHIYGYPLALGAGEVSLAEMVTAYGTFASGGKKPEITGILKVENSNGDILEEFRPREFEEVLDPQIAFLINDILSDRAEAVGPRLFVNGKINAAKTGTATKESKSKSSTVYPGDTWTIGYTPSIVTGVWAGNTDGTALGLNANGYDTAGPVFNAVMTKALSDKAAEPFPEPEGIKQIKVSKASGKKPGANTPDSMIITEIFPSFSVPTVEENMFVTVEIDTVSGLLATEFTPEETRKEVTYQRFEPIADLLNWKNEITSYYQNKIDDEEGDIRIGLPPTEVDNVHTAEAIANAATISFSSITSNSIIDYGNTTVAVNIGGKTTPTKVEYYLDDRLIYRTDSAPFSGILRIGKIYKEGSVHTLSAKVYDELGYTNTSNIEIKIGSSSKATPDDDA